MSSEYLEHLTQEGAMVSSTLSSVLKQQTKLAHEDAPPALSILISAPDIEITTDDIQNVSFSSNIEVSFFTGKNTVISAQGLLNSPECSVSCGSIEEANLKCIAWEASKVSSTMFMVTLKFTKNL